MNFLSYTISADSIRPHISRVEAVQAFPVPNDMTSLHRFVGLINYYHRFVPHCAKIIQPLRQALAAKTFVWDEACQTAFEAVKRTLSDAVMLVHPHQNAPTCITTDASNRAVGGVLEQFIDGLWKAISFFSNKLCQAELNYGAFDREILAIYLAIRHFQYFVEGRKFHVNTGHKQPAFVLQSSSDGRSPQ